MTQHSLDLSNLPDDAVVICFGPGGSVRAVHDDDYPFAKVHGSPPPTRASHVEPVQSGPFAGHWYVDMSPLGDAFGYCLWPPPATRKEALRTEKVHVIERWVLADGNPEEAPDTAPATPPMG